MTLLSAGITGTSAPPTGATHYYPGNEASGTTVADNAGSADLTVNGATWVQDGRFRGGYGLSFDGTDDNLTGSWTHSGPITMIVRCETTNTSEFRDVLGTGAVYIVGNGGSEWRLTTINCRVDDPNAQGTARTLVGRQRYPSGGNYQLALDVYDQNGALIGSDTHSENADYGSPGGDFYVGSGAGEKWFAGLIDPNITIADSWLSDAEIGTILQNYY
ncbi:hypothetical protein [Halococcus sp. AFM35]|uniref:hypothetical protein n=1 Tax=Halococcus sp. AFM35 TaxID=3421653 RepID=UPI003EB8DF11